MEHRWGQRREVDRPVRITASGRVFARGRITNVSMSGAFVVSPLPAKLLSYLELHFVSLHGGRRGSTAIEGQVVRATSAGFGIEWREFAPEAVRDLLRAPPLHAGVAMEGWAQGRHPHHSNSR